MPENLELFGLTAPRDSRLRKGTRVNLPCIQSVRTSRRVGPDGQILFDLVAEVTQKTYIRDTLSGAETDFMGGATIILGPAGDFRYVILKNVHNSDRMEEQLDFQRTTPYWQRSNGRLQPSRDALRLLHRQRIMPDMILD